MILAVERAGLEHLQPRPVDFGEGARFGSDAPEPRVDRCGRLRPVEAGVIDRELRGERRLAGLRGRDRRARRDRVDDAGGEIGSRHRERLEQLAGGLACADGTLLGREDVARVELGDELEDGRPGDRVARDERLLHGGGATPRGQQREVQVDPAVFGQRQQRFAHEPAVCHDHAQVGLERRDRRSRPLIETRRLDDRHPESLGGLRHGRRREHALAPERGGGSRHDPDDLVRPGDETLEGRDSGRRSAGEDETQVGHTPFWRIGAADGRCPPTTPRGRRTARATSAPCARAAPRSDDGARSRPGSARP